MPDSNTSKKNFFISVAIILGVVGSYSGIFYVTKIFTDDFSLAHFLNSKNIMKNHRQELMIKIKRDPHFKNINVEGISEEINSMIKFDREFRKWDTLNKAIILVAISELRNSGKDKMKIILNDYIEISKSFLSLNETKFLNVVLDKIANEKK